MDTNVATVPEATVVSVVHPPMRWGCWSLRTVALLYLGGVLVVPLVGIARAGLSQGMAGLWHAVTLPVAWHALTLTLWTSAVMALINAVMGTLTAYVLVRYSFPGKALLDGVIDLPLAIPTLVTGVMVLILFGPQGGVGAWLNNTFGFQIIFAPPGIVLALLFVSLPLVVRAVEPVLEDLDREPEAAAATLGAPPWTIFWRVTFPALRSAILGGSLLSFARGVGEFGAIVVVAGNIPFHTETAAVYVYGAVEAQDQLGATAVSLVLLVLAFGLVVLVDGAQQSKRAKGPAGRRGGRP